MQPPEFEIKLMKEKPIFLHSLFRTGSTYLWNKFRQVDRYYCFYEPLHQVMAKLTPENITYMMTRDFKAVHHPELEKYYLFEYKSLLKEGQTGIPYFKKGFSYDQFCLNDENPEFKQYIDYLIDGSRGKIPVLKFTRTAFRSKWFKKNYPDSLNIYLVRNPRDQWQSYYDLFRRTNYSGFFLMDLIIASLNKDSEDFLPLSRNIPLVCYRHPQQDKENDFYRIALSIYPDEEKYFIFYYTWFNAFLKNALQSDLIIDINRLTEDPVYNEEITLFLKGYGITDINFSDAEIEEYSSYALSPEIMAKIEEEVRHISLPSFTEEQINRFFVEFVPEDWAYFHFDKEYFSRLKKREIPPDLYSIRARIEKMEKVVALFTDGWFDQAKKKKKPDTPAAQKELAEIDEDRETEFINNCLVEKDLIIYRKDAELQRKDLLLSGKNSQLNRQNITIAEKESDILHHVDELQKKHSLLKEKEKDIVKREQQLLQMERHLERILNSWTYRTGKAIVFPAKTAVALASKSPARVSAFFQDITRQAEGYLTKYEKQINLGDQLEVNFGKHRSGLKYGLRYLKRLQNPRGIMLDAFIERTFFWRPGGIKPHTEPWIGFIHVPPIMPSWFFPEQSNEKIFKTEVWQKSLPYCRGIFTMSAYHRKYLKTKIDIPVNNLIFPTETPNIKWSWDKFRANREKKFIQVGWWLRKLHAIYQLSAKGYKKIFLSVQHPCLPRLIQSERDILIKEGSFNDSMYKTAETVYFLPAKHYDRLLSENIVFVYLYDASANNTVTECIARNTPILINPIEPVREYLGDEYPFYYNSLEEAAAKATDLDLIYQTYHYLVNHSIKKKLSGEYFLKSFVDSEIYRSLKKNPG